MGFLDLFKKKEKKADFSQLPADSPYGEYPSDWPYELKLAQAAQHYQIMKESLALIGKTVVPKTFFYRYKSASQEAKIVAKLCPDHEMGKHANQLLLFMDTNKADIIKDFLDRCDDEHKLPFVKQEIAQYHYAMPAECYTYFQQLLARNKTSEDQKAYTFCSVVFRDNGKPYYYLTNDKTIRCGDQVIVPVGKQNEETTGRVVRIETFRGNEVPVPVDCLKYIIGIQR